MTLDTNNDTIQKTFEGEADAYSDEVILEPKHTSVTDIVGRYMPKLGSPLSKKKSESITFQKKPIDWRNFPRSHHDSFDKDMNQLVPARQYMH